MSNIVVLQRNIRNLLLSESDKYMLSDYPMTSNNLILIQEYRQTLRGFMDTSNVLYYDYTSNIPLPDFPDFPF